MEARFWSVDERSIRPGPMNKRFACLHFVREIRNSLGGVVSTVVDLCQSMAARGHQITLLTCDGRDVPSRWTDAPGQWPRVVEAPHSKVTRLLLSRDALDRCRDLAGEIDVAHLHTPWELGNYQLSPLLRRQRVPYVITVHGMLDHYTMAQKNLKKRMFLALGGRRLFRRATTVHFTAQSEMDQALNYVPGGDRSYVESCALDLTPYRDLPGTEPAYRAFPQIKRDVPTLLFLSRVHPKKRVEALLQAAAILQQAGRRHQVLIAGPGDPQYLAAFEDFGRRTRNRRIHLAAWHGTGPGETVVVSDGRRLRAADAPGEFRFGAARGDGLRSPRHHDAWYGHLARVAIGRRDDRRRFAAEHCRRGDRRRWRSGKTATLGRQGQEFVHRWLDADRVAASYENMYFDAIRRGIPPFDGKPAELKGQVLAAR